jgi:prepilin-type N-terminal cleavage/methylation domain-containing protein
VEVLLSAKSTQKIAKAGFTLVELIIVIAIISILLGIVMFPFHDWQVKSNVEAQVRKMATDISEIRIRAMTMKQRHNIVINSSSYVFQSYSTADLPKCSGSAPAGVTVPGTTTYVSYKLKKDATNYYAGGCANSAGDTFEIDQRGMLVGSGGTVFIDYPGTSATLDCLTIQPVRVNVGKTNGANCDDR